jgi:NADH-quinone oxidoreductase subunit M
MILLWLILIPLIGGLAGWPLGRKNVSLTRWTSLAALALDLVLLAAFWSGSQSQTAIGSGAWLLDWKRDWVPGLGISLHLAVDGLSLVLVALTLFLGIISVLCSWTEVRERVGFYHLNLMAILAGILGVFLSLDLFLFYFFWELMLVPMYFLISIWGHENRVYASLKFFIFTQAGGLLMLLSILGLYFVHGRSTGVYTFDYSLLLGTAMTPKAALWLMLGFFISFTVKLPMVPFHPWLPDAHTEAPTAGSVILAGLLLKTGAYGLLRFVLPLFPGASLAVAPLVMILAVVSILYGAVLAFAQSDLKRLVAYTSVSHMGFALLGIFAGNLTAMQGAVMQMLAHGVSTGALFIIVGMVQERIHTRDMDRMGGFWTSAPRLGGAAMVFALASLGLPGFGNFVAEFMVLLGSYRQNSIATAFAATGLVFAAIYSLGIIQKVFQGGQRGGRSMPDLSMRETGMMTILIIAIFWLGLFPRPALDTAGPLLRTLQYRAPSSLATRQDPGPRGSRELQGGAP